MAPSGGAGMSAFSPLLGDEWTPREHHGNGAVDPKQSKRVDCRGRLVPAVAAQIEASEPEQEAQVILDN